MLVVVVVVILGDTLRRRTERLDGVERRRGAMVSFFCCNEAGFYFCLFMRAQYNLPVGVGGKKGGQPNDDYLVR
jgi:hypothetical protein